MDQNIKTSHASQDQTLPVVETFYSIQGEGSNTGMAAYFIRLGGCNVLCPWCDSKSSWDPSVWEETTPEDLLRRVQNTHAQNVVITGGEPLLHPLDHLCKILRSHGYRLFLETSGTLPLSGEFDWVCLSPKAHRPPLPELFGAADEIKVVVSTAEDLSRANSYLPLVSPDCKLFLQPEWSSNPLASSLIIEYVKTHPQWRISLQTHKLLDIP